MLDEVLGFLKNMFYHTFIYVRSHTISGAILRGEEHCGMVPEIAWERTFSRLFFEHYEVRIQEIV